MYLIKRERGREEEKGKWEILGLFKRLIHSGFTECFKLFSEATPLPALLVPLSTLPHTPFIQSAFGGSQRLVVCHTNSQFCPVWCGRSAKNFSPCSAFLYMETRTVQLEILSLGVSMLVSIVCACASPESASRSSSLWFWGTLCAKEKMVSGSYLICVYLIYMV